MQQGPGIDGRMNPQVECFGCHNKGHRLAQRPKAAAAGDVVNSAGAEGECVISSRKQTAWDRGLAGGVEALRALIKKRPTNKVIIELLLL